MVSGTLWTAGGMATLLLGRKKTALSLFARGLQKLELQWRDRHPDFNGGLAERWNAATTFYDSTHQNQTNRYLHIAGIPIIVGGTIGLFAFKPFRPAWMVSAGAFAAGWALNLVGHAMFEKNAPAFKDDPLSFIAGPVWDLQQLFGGTRTKPVDAETPAETAVPAQPVAPPRSANDVSAMN